MNKVFRILGILITFIILLAGAFLLFTALWVRRTWPKLSAGSIIFQLQSPLEGTGNGMIGTFILTSVVPSLIILAIGIVLYLRIKGKRKLILLSSDLIGAALILVSLCLV